MQYIISLDQLNRTDLPTAGGKGANLGAMIQAGLPVPPGFCVTTAAYNAFVRANRLEEAIQARAAACPPDDPAALEAASAEIRRMFERGSLPEEMAADIRAAYRSLQGEEGALPVAVRSSATAEDLPDLSFAGQQDTYLNIIGEAALLDAVKRCWASLWTARAIGYRARNQIDPAEVALAVVVQQMVPSEVSGVLFTANPLTGKRAETVIDATLGLGEALVSGMVEPDHYITEDSGAGEAITHKTLGQKAVAVVGVEGGGTRVVEQSAAAIQALPDAQILELAGYGREAERYFGTPQDMEWGWAGGRLYVLQSRPITSLYPIPRRWLDGPGQFPREPEAYFSFASWQGMLQPISPLGMDSFTGLVVGFARALSFNTTIREQELLLPAGERLFVNITGLLRSGAGRAIADAFIGAIDPVSATIVEGLIKDPRFALSSEKMSLRTRLRLARVLAPLISGVLYNLMWPERGRLRLRDNIDRKLEEVRETFRACGTLLGDVEELATLVEQLPASVPSFLLPFLLPGIISGMAPLQILLRRVGEIENGPELVMELTRGLPHNVTTEMDLELWTVSRAIGADAQASGYFRAASAERLAAEYHAGRLPAAAQRALDGFLRVYGMRGVAEIDLIKPRWKEDPLHIIQVLQSYLELGDNGDSPQAVFRGGAEKARQAADTLVAAFRRQRFGWFKARLARFLISRIRALAGLRETPKFTIVRFLGIVREAVLRAGENLAREGVLLEPGDIFFLHLWELKDLAAPENLAALHALVNQRRASYERELNRRQIPHVMLSDGTSYYEASGFEGGAADEGEGVLVGSPVSAGLVEGTVRVMLDPHIERLLPGEILVCPATDPAWTPLFLAAGGLVMEVGGMITHGSVVAREYGIPAVVGVHQATTRLQTGQRVRVDGSAGRITVL